MNKLNKAPPTHPQKIAFFLATEFVLYALYHILQSSLSEFYTAGTTHRLLCSVWVPLSIGISILAFAAILCTTRKIDLSLVFSCLSLPAMGLAVVIASTSTDSDPYKYAVWSDYLTSIGLAYLLYLVCFGAYRFLQERKQTLFTRKTILSVSVGVILLLCIFARYSANYHFIKYSTEFYLFCLIAFQLFPTLLFPYIFTSKKIKPYQKVIYSLAALLVAALAYITISLSVTALVFLLIVYLYFVIRYLPLPYCIAHFAAGIVGAAVSIFVSIWSVATNFVWRFEYPILDSRIPEICERIYIWLYPTAFSPYNESYQTLSSAYALLQGSSWFSALLPYFVCATNSTLTFSNIVFHFGYVYAIVAIALILLFCWRCAVTARRTQDKPIVSALCGVVGVVTFAQTVINIMMCCGLLPLMLLYLPFFSNATTSLVLQFSMVFFVLYQSTHAAEQAPCPGEEPSTDCSDDSTAQTAQIAHKKSSLLTIVLCLLLFICIACFGALRVHGLVSHFGTNCFTLYP